MPMANGNENHSAKKAGKLVALRVAALENAKKNPQPFCRHVEEYVFIGTGFGAHGPSCFAFMCLSDSDNDRKRPHKKAHYTNP